METVLAGDAMHTAEALLQGQQLNGHRQLVQDLVSEIRRLRDGDPAERARAALVTGELGEHEPMVEELLAEIEGRRAPDPTQVKADVEARVSKLLGVLSYSETVAVGHLHHELGGDTGLLVASKIADRVGLTRSVIVNALRKLQSAGVLSTQSLGMKGTHIKVLQPAIWSRLGQRAA